MIKVAAAGIIQRQVRNRIANVFTDRPIKPLTEGPFLQYTLKAPRSWAIWRIKNPTNRRVIASRVFLSPFWRLLACPFS